MQITPNLFFLPKVNRKKVTSEKNIGKWRKFRDES
mgnify:CR=1 FL=1